MNEDRKLFLEALERVGRSAARLEYHRRTLAPLMPLDAARVESLGETELTRVEAMLKKFEQFIDDMRRGVFRGVLKLAAEPVEGLSQRQVLDRLESLGCIESGDRFVALIRLRNGLAHEYPDQPHLQANAINQAWQAIQDLLALFHRVRDYVVQTGLVAREDLSPYPPKT